MAERYTRRINLYINGKEVRNDVKSIRAEMSKLTNEQARMVIGSDEYVQHAQKIKQLKGIMAQHVQDISNVKKGWSLQGMADSFNKYFGIMTAAMASFAGVALTIKSSVQAFAEFDDKLADVMKTTGLTKDQVKTLNGELEKIDTRSAQTELLDLARVAGKLGITSEDEILAFVRAADKIKVALSEDLGGDVEESINQLGKLVDIFKLKDEFGIEDALIKTGSAINSLGAAGTANEAYMVEFAKRLAGIAPAAGISIQQVLGLGATLDELGQTSEVSGTAIVQVIGKMFKDTADYAAIAGMSIEDFTTLLNTDANEAFIKLLEGVKGSGTGFGEMAKNMQGLGLDGARSTAVLGTLAENIDKLREKQAFSNTEFEKGTSILKEFATKNESAQAELEKAKKSFTAMQVELGERLSPAYTSVIHKSSTMLKMLGATVEFLFKYGKQLVVIVASIAAYTIATKLATLWQNRSNIATAEGILVQKLQALAFRAQFAAISLYNAAVALLTGKLKVAAIQFRAFSAALMANPIGIVVGVVTALAGALYLYSRRLTDAQKLQKTLNGVNLEAEQQIVQQRLETEQLLKVARNENRSKADRIAAIDRLNKISPEYLKGITLETINTDAAKTATDNYINSLRQKAKVQAAQEKLVEIEKELLDIQSGEGSAPDFWQQTWNAVKTGGNAAAMYAANAVTSGNNLVSKSKELNLQKEKLLEITEQQYNLDNNATKPSGSVDYSAQIKAQQTELEKAEKMPAITDAEIDARKKKIAAINLEIKALKELAIAANTSKAGDTGTTDGGSTTEDNTGSTPTATKSKIKAKEAELEEAKKMPESNDQEIAARNQKIEAIEREIAALKELGTTKQGDTAKKEAYDNNTSDSAKAQIVIKKQLLDKVITEEQANDAILASEIEFLEKKMALQIMYGDNYQDTETALLDKRLQAAKDADQKSEEDKKAAHDKILEDLAANEAGELNVIKKQLADKSITEEQAQQDILTKEIEYLNKRIVLRKQWGEDTTDLEAQVLDKTTQKADEALKSDEARAARLHELHREFDDDEIIKAQEKAEALAELDALFKAGALESEEEYQRLKTKIVEKYEGNRFEKTRNYLSAINDLLGGASDFFNDLKDAELAKAGDNAEKRAQIEKEYAEKQKNIAISQAVIAGAMAIMQLWANSSSLPEPYNTIYKIAMTAVIGATTIAQISKIRSAEFSVGGSTGDGPANEPAGIVHKGEWVAPKWMTTDPEIGQYIAALESVRQSKNKTQLPPIDNSYQGNSEPSP